MSMAYFWTYFVHTINFIIFDFVLIYSATNKNFRELTIFLLWNKKHSQKFYSFIYKNEFVNKRSNAFNSQANSMIV